MKRPISVARKIISFLLYKSKIIIFEKKLVMTGRVEGASSKEFCDYILETIEDPELEQKWKSYQP